MLPLTARIAGLVLSYGTFFIIYFHILRSRLSSLPCLFLAFPLAYLSIQPLSSGIFHTDFVDELVPLFLSHEISAILSFPSLLAMLAVANFLSKRVERQAYRSLSHIAGGLFIVCFLLLFGVEVTVLVLVGWLVAFIFAESLRCLSRRGLGDGLIIFVDRLLSKAARNSLEQKFFTPSLFTILASLLLVLFFPLCVSAPAILTLALADPAAALVGTHLGFRKWQHNPKKSIEGSLAFFFTAFVVCSFFAGIWKAILIAIAIAIFESLDLQVSDNLVIPVLTGMLLSSI